MSGHHWCLMADQCGGGIGGNTQHTVRNNNTHGQQTSQQLLHGENLNLKTGYMMLHEPLYPSAVSQLGTMHGPSIH